MNLIKNLSFKNFQCFEELQIDNLKRVNLNIIFDCLVANQDIHHEDLGFVVSSLKKDYLPDHMRIIEKINNLLDFNKIDEVSKQ